MAQIRNLAVSLPVKDGHVLVLEGSDRFRGLDFYRAIGGGIEFGETAEQALRRELIEELGCEIESAELLTVVENIFEYEGAGGHEIVHVFSVESAALDAVPLDALLRILDTGNVVRWIPIDSLREGPPLLPEGAAALLPDLAIRHL